MQCFCVRLKHQIRQLWYPWYLSTLSLFNVVQYIYYSTTDDLRYFSTGEVQQCATFTLKDLLPPWLVFDYWWLIEEELYLNSNKGTSIIHPHTYLTNSYYNNLISYCSATKELGILRPNNYQMEIQNGSLTFVRTITRNNGVNCQLYDFSVNILTYLSLNFQPLEGKFKETIILQVCTVALREVHGSVSYILGARLMSRGTSLSVRTQSLPDTFISTDHISISSLTLLFYFIFSTLDMVRGGSEDKKEWQTIFMINLSWVTNI